MTDVRGYDTYWELEDGREVQLIVNYYYYPPAKGGRNEYGVPIEPDEGAVVEVVNIRTREGQDPMLVLPDWDRDYVVQVVSSRIIEDLSNG